MNIYVLTQKFGSYVELEGGGGGCQGEAPGLDSPKLTAAHAKILFRKNNIVFITPFSKVWCKTSRRPRYNSGHVIYDY